MVTEFERFLRHHGNESLLRKFKSYTEEYHGEDVKMYFQKTSPDGYFTYAFRWDSSKEGVLFWKTLDEAWSVKLSEL